MLCQTWAAGIRHRLCLPIPVFKDHLAWIHGIVFYAGFPCMRLKKTCIQISVRGHCFPQPILAESFSAGQGVDNFLWKNCEMLFKYWEIIFELFFFNPIPALKQCLKLVCWRKKAKILSLLILWLHFKCSSFLERGGNPTYWCTAISSWRSLTSWKKMLMQSALSSPLPSGLSGVDIQHLQDMANVKLLARPRPPVWAWSYQLAVAAAPCSPGGCSKQLWSSALQLSPVARSLWYMSLCPAAVSV